MALHDYPNIEKLFRALEAERDAILDEVAPLRAEYEALHQKLSPGNARLRELGKMMRGIEQPRMSQLCGELAQLARAAGGKAISDPLRNGRG